jgi:hypothetical protein
MLAVSGIYVSNLLRAANRNYWDPAWSKHLPIARVGKLDDVAAAGSLLTAPHDIVGNEAG